MDCAAAEPEADSAAAAVAVAVASAAQGSAPRAVSRKRIARLIQQPGARAQRTSYKHTFPLCADSMTSIFGKQVSLGQPVLEVAKALFYRVFVALSNE
jgi:hypothetical protein